MKPRRITFRTSWLGLSIRRLLAGGSRDRVVLLSIDHIHDNFDHLETRLSAYHHSSRAVRTAVVARLDQRIALNEVGHFTAGTSALMAGAVGILAAIVAISLAGYEEYLAAIVKLTNASSGRVNGISSAQSVATIRELISPIAVGIMVIVVLLLLNVMLGRWRDNRRATAIAWRNPYLRESDIR
jgi:hypothetical protein